MLGEQRSLFTLRIKDVVTGDLGAGAGHQYPQGDCPLCLRGDRDRGGLRHHRSKAVFKGVFEAVQKGVPKGVFEGVQKGVLKVFLKMFLKVFIKVSGNSIH